MKSSTSLKRYAVVGFLGSVLLCIVGVLYVLAQLFENMRSPAVGLAIVVLAGRKLYQSFRTKRKKTMPAATGV